MDSTNKDIDIEEYFDLVKSLAAKYVYLGLQFDDLYQEGVIGLLEAKERFDNSRGVAFTTYATFWIKKRILGLVDKEMKESGKNVVYNETLDAVKNDSIDPVVENYHNDSLNNKINIPEEFPEDEKKILDLYFNQNKTLTEISLLLNISREKARQIKQKVLRRIRSKSDITKK